MAAQFIPRTCTLAHPAAAATTALTVQALELAHRLLNFKAPSTGTHLFLPCERLKDKVGGA